MPSHEATRSIIKHANEALEYFFKEGCYILELLNDPQDEACSIARARVLPGKQTRKHKLIGTAERYIILSGEGLVTVDDETALVHKGSVVSIPVQSAQKIKNTGSNDLVFLAICTPRFKSENYVDLED